MRVLKISAVALGLLAGLPSLVSLAAPANAQMVGSAAREAPNREIMHPERRALWERSLVADAELDAEALAALWHPEGAVQIGAIPQVTGRENVRSFFAGFFASGLFVRLEHEMLEVWDLDDVLIYSAVAIYTREDGSVLRVPYTNTVKYRDGLFYDYRVFIDTKPLTG